jgi:hypothetical protein
MGVCIGPETDSRSQGCCTDAIRRVLRYAFGGWERGRLANL